MANTLTNLIPDAYAALDVVSRELTGLTPAVLRDSRTDRVALNQTVRVPITPINNAGSDITPAMAIPSGSDQAIGNQPVTITKSRYFPFSWTGEEIYSVDTGPGILTVQQDQIAQALRAAANEIETDIGTALKNGASRAYGTAGTTPFGTAADMSDFAQVYKILDDNGAPKTDRRLVLSTTASANIRGKQSSLFKVNEAGDSALLRDGMLGTVMGMGLGESAGISQATAGTGSGYLINNGSGYAIGDTALTLDTGSGTILAGDVITIGSFKYVVASALAANVVTIAAPGLRAAVADNAAVTVNATSVRNAAFRRSAIVLATRLPAVPPNGDLATDRQTITDERTGLSFELAYYPGFRMGVYHVSVAWGVKVIKPEHIALLLG